MKLLVSDYDKTIEVEGIFRKDHIKNFSKMWYNIHEEGT